MIEIRYSVKIENCGREVLVEVPLKLINLYNYNDNHILNYSIFKNRTLRIDRSLDIEKILDQLNFLINKNRGVSKYYLKIRIRSKTSYRKKLTKKNIIKGMMYISLVDKNYARYIRKKFQNLLYNINIKKESQLISDILDRIFNDSKRRINMNIYDYLTLRVSKELLN